MYWNSFAAPKDCSIFLEQFPMLIFESTHSGEHAFDFRLTLGTSGKTFWKKTKIE